MNEPKYWQIAAGNAGRSFANHFFEHSIALLGPGDAGPWNADRDDSLYEGHYVRHFASEMTIGDIFVLRSGRSQLLAVGVVASDYMHLEQFSDLNGWDMQHCRRVRWFRLPAPHDFGRPIFGGNPSRFSRVWESELLQFAERFINSPPTDWQSKPPPALPPEEPPLHTVPPYLTEIVDLARDLANLYWDRQRLGDPPSEHEIVSHLVVPFFRALGWRQEQIAVEWRRIDVALFRTLPRIPENCHLVVEAKTLGAGVEGDAVEQGKGYASVCGSIADVLVTDGVRYRLYSCAEGYQEIGYANLTRLKMRALDLFERLKRP